MKSNRRLVLLVCSVAAVAAASIARSDGVCNAGFRDSTAAERGTMTRVLEAAKKALPPAPAGWAILGEDQVSVPSGICRDYERSPWGYSFTRYYQRVDDQEARNKIIADAAVVQAAAMKQKQPRLDAVMARMNKLSQAQAALVQKGDLERATAMNTDLAKAQEDYEKILDEGDSAQQMAAVDEKTSRDLTMTITVQVNAATEIQGIDAKRLPTPPGALAALRWNAQGRVVNEDLAVILLGQWTSSGPGRWQLLRRPNAAVHAAHVISIHIVADTNRIAQTVNSIDAKSLATTLQD
jgi:hypothetical protein